MQTVIKLVSEITLSCKHELQGTWLDLIPGVCASAANVSKWCFYRTAIFIFSRVAWFIVWHPSNWREGLNLQKRRNMNLELKDIFDFSSYICLFFWWRFSSLTEYECGIFRVFIC
jgi:hypothetical protein